jgi:hypothetical protein
MANQYDTNLKLQAIADAIGNSGSSGLISALEDIADAVAGGGGGGSSTAGLVSDNFSETDTYDLGDFCIHNNTLYVCINAITTPGAWDLSDWQATNAGIQLSSLNSAITKHDFPQNFITLTIDTAYTAESDGYVRINVPYATNINNQTVTIQLNGVTVLTVFPSTTGTTQYVVYAKKGMTVKFAKGASATITPTGVFIPLV